MNPEAKRETTAETSPHQTVDVRSLGSIGVELSDMTVSPKMEQNRKDVISRNLTTLKKRFGEEFLKGKRLDSGEYTDGGARETLAVFMEMPGFADELKRIIPSTHQALTTLCDNQDYIRAVLEDRYRDSTNIEKKVLKNPFELARQVGYELTGPFESVEDFAGYANDFRKNELICTFNNPQSRLKAYHILWLRHEQADSIVPADELTQENITKPWQDYLKKIGHYDATNDSYDLEDLLSAREDPYGTSSMSVQISRRGNQVSIKNRYNQTVAGPDSTYKNNLDNVTYGLKSAVYHKIGREDLLNDVNRQKMQEGYILDNDGGIHKYYWEVNNVYLGHFEYIENGVVKTIDKGAYDMLAPDLYIGKNRKGETLQLGNVAGTDTSKTSFEILEDGTRRLHIYDKKGNLHQVYSYSYDDKNKISNVSLTIAEGATTGAIDNNPALAKLTIAEGATTGAIDNNSTLTELIIAEGVTTGGIFGNRALAELTIGENAKTVYVFGNPALTKLTVAEGATVESISDNSALAELAIAEGATVGSIYDYYPDITINNRSKL